MTAIERISSRLSSETGDRAIEAVELDEHAAVPIDEYTLDGQIAVGHALLVRMVRGFEQVCYRALGFCREQLAALGVEHVAETDPLLLVAGVRCAHAESALLVAVEFFDVEQV